ncbi:MAG TPA: helix-turn-helix domain-containing protein [Actinoplanes sp.]|nr:helix-turn-helix domain-containing protein [Actinoplanes sp.]
MLEPLGLGPTEEAAYRALLQQPDSSMRQVADRAGVALPRARAALHNLVALRLAQRADGRPARFRAAPPDIAITALVNERETALDQARRAVPDLLAEYQLGTAASLPTSLLEVLTGPGVGHRTFVDLLAATREEVLTFDRVSEQQHAGAVEVETEAPTLARGVAYRAVYESAAIEMPGRLPHLRQLAQYGEQARLVPALPFKLLICDRRRAMLPLTMGAGRQTESVVLIGASVLLDGLVDVFESYWQRGVPLWSTGRREVAGSGLAEEEYEVLHLLLTGLKDEAIARQLGISMRTTRRRISSLLTTLGAASRFQAGAEAIRRGLV